ncbi:hypothetical protein IL54_0886 [Sphingobium sp. ba1]|nr:hypothetical protein IL54_0886 [Sphingobium sp. ba1]
MALMGKASCCEPACAVDLPDQMGMIPPTR